MSRILIRAGKDPRHPISPEATLAFGEAGVFGSNVGNIAFLDAVFRLIAVPGANVVPSAFRTEYRKDTTDLAAAINSEFDAFVVPLANAFRDSFVNQLRRMTQLITQLTIPVVVVGVGAQGTFEGEVKARAEVAEVTAGFMRAVLDRSAKVGVRGAVTADFLRQLGFGSEHVEVIGCPSVYLRGPDYQVKPKVDQITNQSAINLTISPYRPQFADFVNRATDQYPNLIYIPQRHGDLELMLWGTEWGASKNPEMPVHRGHRLYLEDRMRFFVDSRTWLEFNATRDYSIGTRVHGSIMTLVAGTPATMLVHDSRTRELAEYHDIPWLALNRLTGQETVADLYERSNWAAFNTGLAARFDVLTGFLTANGLQHVAMPGLANPEFDAQLAAAALPGPVQTLNAPEPAWREVMASRLAWLHETNAAAEGRAKSRYRPPFDPPVVRNDTDAKGPAPLRLVRRVIAKLHRWLGD